MDILEIVRAQIGSLPEGPHSTGLKSVLRHIEAAHRHLSRGQSEGDDSAFSDAIYRSNQAFEGSIKEAYRVLAQKEPQKTTPYNIEQYMQKNDLFRPRVLSQFTNYRTEWRNPATHDYNLDFDEDEAFLAIVSVSAFSKMLIDQIAERLAFASVVDDADGDIPTQLKLQGRPLLDEVEAAFLVFLLNYEPRQALQAPQTEPQLLGSLSGFLSLIDDEFKIDTFHRVQETGRIIEIDMLVSRGDESVVIEMRKGGNSRSIESGLRNLEAAMMRTGIRSGILLVHGLERVQYAVERRESPGRTQIRVIAPVK